MKKITYRLWLVAMVTVAFIGAANAQNNTKECMKVGIMPSFITPWGNYMFKDYFKHNSYTIPNDAVKDINGYPLSGGFSVSVLSLDAVKNIFLKDHTLSWEGAANATTIPLRIRIPSNGFIIVPNSYKTSNIGGQCQIRLDTNVKYTGYENLDLIFRNPNPTVDNNNPQHVRNIKLIRTGYENTDYVNYPFNPEFIDQIKPFSETNFRLSQFLYFSDSTNNIRWEDRIMPTSISQSVFGVVKRTSYAYEHMIQLCNETKSNATIFFPLCADDNYLFQMASLFKNNLKYQQTVTLHPAAFGTMGSFLNQKANNHPIYKNDVNLAYADYTGRAWRIWEKVLGSDSKRLIRAIGDTNQAKFHGVGNFEIIHTYFSFFYEEQSKAIYQNSSLTSNQVYNYLITSFSKNHPAKDSLRQRIQFAKKYNAKTTLEDLGIPSGFNTSDTTRVYFTESQIENLTRVIMDTLNNMGVSLAFTGNYQATFQPNKLNEAGVREAAPYFAVVNNLPTEGDCAKPSAVENATNVQLFQVFPNPTTGEVTLTSSKSNMGDKLKIECYNSLGTSIYAGEMMLNESANILQNQSVGIYNLIITTAEGKKYQQKILKN